MMCATRRGGGACRTPPTRCATHSGGNNGTASPCCLCSLFSCVRVPSGPCLRWRPASDEGTETSRAAAGDCAVCVLLPSHAACFCRKELSRQAASNRPAPAASRAARVAALCALTGASAPMFQRRRLLAMQNEPISPDSTLMQRVTGSYRSTRSWPSLRRLTHAYGRRVTPHCMRSHGRQTSKCSSNFTREHGFGNMMRAPQSFLLQTQRTHDLASLLHTASTAACLRATCGPGASQAPRCVHAHIMPLHRL